MITAVCWRCEQPGHVAADCRRPPAATRRELDDRIERHKERWISGAITIEMKRQFITAEAKAFEKARAA